MNHAARRTGLFTQRRQEKVTNYKFKMGDRVVRTGKSFGDVLSGQVYTVASILDRGRVGLLEHPGMFNVYSFELSEPPLADNPVDADAPEEVADASPVHEPLPVSGYTAQPSDKVDAVNVHKEIEEHLLRHMEQLQIDMPDLDRRWLYIAKTDFERAFMALNRAVFKPGRIALADD